MGIEPSSLNEQMLRAMHPRDRAALKLRTQAEAEQAYEAKTEKAMHDQFSSWLRLNDMLFIHARMDKKSPLTIGWPDFSIFASQHLQVTECGCSRTIFVEFKCPGKHPTPEQAAMLSRLEKDGFACLVATSVQDAIAFVRREAGL